MKKIVAVFIMMLIPLLSCGGDSYKYSDLGEPSEKWIGKTVKIEFGDFGENYAHKAFVVKIKELKAVNTMKFDVKYFVTEKPFVYTPTPVSAIYFHWFELGDKDGIISYKEAIPIGD